ncbi:cation diffusion facilitator family transporter [Acidocella aromatica]|uniref:Protein p34 n=1 Tax=Acidocella aromatica TaxID=1303579 RepID=A0A840VBG3_9PROT|nr:cation diffusion facilitator family transporter [Acidocella aromatica]MBB5373238.1 cation diffusion facilitator family transporter [Acidocella aromatica]
MTGTKTNQRLRRLAANTSFVMALSLVGIKVAAWALTGSMALLAAAVDGVLDVCTSAVTFIGVRYAGRPEDHNHRYGHGKGETLAAFLQALLLVGAGCALIYQAGDKLIHPTPLAALEAGVAMTGGSLTAVACLVGLQSWVIRRTHSTAIIADRQHYVADIIVNIGVLVSLGITWLTGWDRVDPLIGLSLSLYLIWCAVGIIRGALHVLLDEELPKAERARIKAAVRGCAGVVNLHDLRTRNASDRRFIEFHLEMDGDITVRAGHDICEAATEAVLALYGGNAEVLVHAEPAGIDDERLDRRIRPASSPLTRPGPTPGRG